MQCKCPIEGDTPQARVDFLREPKMDLPASV